MATRAGRSGPAGDSGQVLWSWRELGGNVSGDTLVSSCRHAHRPPAFERRAMQGHWRSQTIPCMGVSTRPKGFEADIRMYSTFDQQDLPPIDRKREVQGKGVTGRGDCGGCGYMNKKNKRTRTI